MKPSTQRALNLLRAADGGWVSGNRLFQVAGTRYGGRVFELRHEEGLTIEKRPAPNGSHVPEYRIVEDVQLSLTLDVAS